MFLQQKPTCDPTLCIMPKFYTITIPLMFLQKKLTHDPTFHIKQQFFMILIFSSITPKEHHNHAQVTFHIMSKFHTILSFLQQMLTYDPTIYIKLNIMILAPHE